MSWKSFFQILLAGVVAGAAQGAATQIPPVPQPGQPAVKPNWSNVGVAAGIGAIIGALGSLASNPVPPPAPPAQ
jgi:hypothetical protein